MFLTHSFQDLRTPNSQLSYSSLLVISSLSQVG